MESFSQPPSPRLSAGTRPHTAIDRLKVPPREKKSGNGKSYSSLAPWTCHYLQLFYSWGNLETEWLKPSQGHSYGVQSTIRQKGNLLVSRIKGHESWKGFQEVIWLTCFTAGDQWNLPRLTTVWGHRLHNAPSLLVQVCSSLQFFLKSNWTLSCCNSVCLPNSVCLLSVFHGESRVSLMWGLIFSIEESALGQSWKTYSERPCGELSTAEGTLVCIFGSFILWLNARQLHFPDSFSSRIIFPGEGKAEGESVRTWRQKIVSDGIHSLGNCRATTFRLGEWKGSFLTLRAIIEVRSDSEGGCGSSFPGGLTDRGQVSTQGWLRCAPLSGSKGTLYLDFFQGSSPALKKHQFWGFWKVSVCAGTNKVQLHEMPFGFGSHPALNQHRQA